MSFETGASYFAATAGLFLAIAWSRPSTKKKNDVVEVPKKSAETVPSKDTLDIPVIDFSKFFSRRENPGAYSTECAKVAHALHNYGICIVRDPRVEDKHNNRFLDMMEKYFEGSDGVRDARPEFHYQVGVTPEGVGKRLMKCS